MMTTRGIRNCNPLNIRRTKTVWQGQRSEQQDGSFVQFDGMKWGWRAAFVLLTRNYFNQHKLTTVRSIIYRWAPPQDHNATEAYVKRVCQLMDYEPDAYLGIPTMVPSRWMQLAWAMAIVENGSADQLDPLAMLEGWRLSRE